MTFKTVQHVSLQNLKSFGPIETELRAKEVGEVSVIWENGKFVLYGKLGWCAFLPSNMAAAIAMYRDLLNSEQL